MSAARPHRITFQQKRRITVGNLGGEPILNSHGDETEEWVDAFEEDAAIYYGTGAEQRNAAQTQGEQVATFEVLSNSRTRELSVATYRIKYQGGAWDIHSASDIGLNVRRRINAVRAAS